MISSITFMAMAAEMLDGVGRPEVPGKAGYRAPRRRCAVSLWKAWSPAAGVGESDRAARFGIMKPRSTALLLLAAALTSALPSAALAASNDTLELMSRGASLGRIPRTVASDGTAFVPAGRLAKLIGASWKVSGKQATLTLGKRTAQFTRDQSRVVVAGQRIGLDSPPR